MSNPDASSSKGGFLRRFFSRSGPVSPAGGGHPRPDGSPAETAAEGIPAHTVEQTAGKRLTKSKSVLIVAESDGAMRRWKREIEEWGYGIELLTNGREGIELLYEVAYDAMLLDYQAPGIDGDALLREIRSHEELQGLFIGVFVRDKAGASDLELAALDAGASRVFQRNTVKVDGILTALKTALFPRVLQAQPRPKTTTPSFGNPSAYNRQAPAPIAAPVIMPPPVTAPPVVQAPPPPSVPPPAIELPKPSILPRVTNRISTTRIPASTSVPAPATLPRTTVRVPGPGTTAAASTTPSPNKKILIIDADETAAGIYRAQIEAAGYEVEVALDGETGFHDLYKVDPAALLLDLLLPGGLSGSEILKKVRAQKKFEKIPVLVFTNIYTRDVEEEARAAGVLRLFNKAAATPRDVVEALNECFLPTSAVLNGSTTAPAAIKFDAGNLNPAATTLPPVPAVAPRGVAVPAPVPAAVSNDAEFQAEIRESLIQGAPEFVKDLRSMLQTLLRSQGDFRAQSAQLLELYTRVHSLTANAALAGFTKVARLSAALEAMLREFEAKPEGLNASTKRTLTQAMDFLAMLFTGAATHDSGQPINEQILIVDDEIISRRVIGHSLEKAGLKSTAVSHPDEALKLLETARFDLIFLDVEMPGMNGFDLCKKLRAMPLHAKTPVIFVTALSGFESRAKSSLSGGDDFIGKPFSYIELAVKGLIYVLKGAIAKQAAAEAGAPLPPAGPPPPPVPVRRTQVISAART